MTDEEIIRACAEKVMGWKWRLPKGRHEGWYSDQGKWSPGEFGYDWNPLTSDADAGMVMDRMQSKDYGIDFCASKDWAACRFFKENDRSGEMTVRGEIGVIRRRAIVLAALKAIGVECV